MGYQLDIAGFDPNDEEAFFNATKTLHNALQGSPQSLTD